LFTFFFLPAPRRLPPPLFHPPDSTRPDPKTNKTNKKKKSWLARLKVIFRATKQHATNLARFVATYKTLLLIQRKVNGGKARPHDTFFAGLLGGYLVFGERNAINEQVRDSPILSFSDDLL
jgi:hypothetical protein